MKISSRKVLRSGRSSKDKTQLLADITAKSSMSSPMWANGKRGLRILIPSYHAGDGPGDGVNAYWVVELDPNERDLIQQYISEHPNV